MPTSRSIRPFLVLAILATLSATLFPTGAEEPGGWAPLFLGQRGVADALLNVIVFLPLGTALVLCGWHGYRACLFAALLSSGIELAQLFLPGRYTSPSDVLSNTVGAALGIIIVRSASYWLLPEGRRAMRLALASSLGIVFVTGVTGILLEPSLPHSTYFGQWTPNLGHLEWYRGRVLEARLGSLRIVSGRLAESRSVRSALLAGTPLHVHALAGPPIPALGPLLSIYDEGHREIILLGPDRDDLVFRYRTRAAALRLDQRDLRLHGAMRNHSAGDTLQIKVWRQPADYCIAINGSRTCGLGFTVGSGWAGLLYPESLPTWLKMLLDWGWVTALFVPIGFWARKRWGVWLAGAALLAGLVAVPATTGLVPTPPGEFAGALAGLILGMGLQALVRSRTRSAQVSSG